MIVSKSITLKGILEFSGYHLIWLTAWMTLITTLYYYTRSTWFEIPWLPVAVIGTAVAFYVGFKNNQAYDRLWEARKVWGAITNTSRMWVSMVKAYIINPSIPEEEMRSIKLRLVYRHIAWLYQLREQLLVPTIWEHVSLRWTFGSLNQRRRDKYGVGAFDSEEASTLVKKYLMEEEYAALQQYANGATQLIDTQTQELAKLNLQGSLETFKQLGMQQALNGLYDSQGQAERIKKFPLPRQYGSLSFFFVSIFILLLPFGILAEFIKMGEVGIWLSVPFGVVVGWVYVVMELIGDYSENPFEGLPNDVPMLSICRSIEIDLLQLMGETDVPSPVEPVNNVLM